jgi:acetyl-CoA carboxylase carboxyltransferase component
MGSKSLGADLAYAWPGAELAVVGPESAVDLLYGAELAGAPAERRRQLVDAYKEANANPYLAAERGYVDDVIEPASTRRVLHQALEMLASKRQDAPPRKHGNVPL